MNEGLHTDQTRNGSRTSTTVEPRMPRARRVDVRGQLGLTATLLLAAVGGCDSEGPAGSDPQLVADAGSTLPHSSGAAADAAATTAIPSTPSAANPAAPGATDANGCATFDGAYGAIQKVIFEGRGCTAAACHGAAKVGGLDLRADVAWENLVDAKSANSALARVQPGTATESFLYKKLQAATVPGSVSIGGSPMPVGTAPLTTDELEAVRIWILKGAPKTGAVADPSSGKDVGSLLDACLPPVKPVKAKPLEPPAPDEGVQFVLPSYLLKAGTEVEHCTPFAFDFTDEVPAEYKDVARNVMYVNGTRVRQDPQSHHLVLMNPKKDLSSVSAGDSDWTCRGGTLDGQKCDPTKGSRDCAEGVCGGKSTPGPLCGVDTSAATSGVGGIEGFFGILSAGLGVLAQGGMPDQIANTQSPQEYLPPLDGVYSEIPLRGILYFDSHAFNLTDEDTVLDARVNYLYAKKRDRQMVPTNVIDANHIGQGQAPFTRKTYCAKTVVPQGVSIAMMTGHTHRHGERFWVNDAGGKLIYENFNYNDPEYKHYEPWLEFTSPDDAQRTLEYCTTYNNGLNADGSFDTTIVTKKSRMPPTSGCTPVACTAGKIAATCTTDHDCDSAAGKSDGKCDACPIAGGSTTEDEMFVLMPWYVLPRK